MNILAIDPGTHCGYALMDTMTKTILASGVWELSIGRHEGGGMRFVRLRRYIADIIQSSADVVFYEEVKRHMGTDAAHIYGGIIAVITSECEGHAPPIPYKGIPVGTIKRVATGKGNADKEKMMDAAAARWPEHKCKDDNEADARWLAVAALEYV